MRTEAELRRLMQSRVEPGERGQAIVSAVLARLKEQRYLDDQSYAETYARLRQQNEKLGAAPRPPVAEPERRPCPDRQ